MKATLRKSGKNLDSWSVKNLLMANCHERVPAAIPRGRRKAIVDAEDWEGPAYQTCRDSAWVASRFELSRRKDNLTFNHHAEVAALPPADLDWQLDC
jgi:hypothetical protein